MGKVCVVGCGTLKIDYGARTVSVGDLTLKEGDFISIDGFTGEVMAGQVAAKPSEVVQERPDGVGRPLHLAEHAAGVVADQPGQAQPGGELVHERPEADPLHDPLDPYPAAHPSVHRRLVSGW
jgi:hypothetical protein